MTRILALTIILAGCGLTPREQAHWGWMSEFYAVKQEGADPLNADPAGAIHGDCDDFAAAAMIRSGRECKLWVVREPGKTWPQHMVCLFDDGYYADNMTLFGSTDKSRYEWRFSIPDNTIPVIDR